MDFDALFRLLIRVNYNILILSIQKLDFIISEIDNNIYKYKKYLRNIDKSSMF